MEMPDFENFAYKIAVSPGVSQVRAWGKLRECERRVAMVEWAESLNDPAKANMRVFLDDSISAFLLTFEATIQVLKDQWEEKSGKTDFYRWLERRPEYDFQICGLRTLRHFEAHVESAPVKSFVDMRIGSHLGDGTTQVDVSRKWLLRPLEQSDLDRLKRPPLEGKLSDWNTEVSRLDARSILIHGLIQLKKILEAAEMEI